MSNASKSVPACLREVEVRSRCALPSYSCPLAVVPRPILPPRGPLATPRRGAHLTVHRPWRAHIRSPEPAPSHPVAKRFPNSGLCGVAAGLLEHRLEVRLRGLQSIMVNLLIPFGNRQLRRTLPSLPPNFAYLHVPWKAVIATNAASSGTYHRGQPECARQLE